MHPHPILHRAHRVWSFLRTHLGTSADLKFFFCAEAQPK